MLQNKVSSIKRSNQRQTKLKKQGKLKKKHNRKKVKRIVKRKCPVKQSEPEIDPVELEKQRLEEEYQSKLLTRHFNAETYKFLAQATLERHVLC